MTLNPDLVGFLAGELERGSETPCGGCGEPHASSAADWGHDKRCGCKCCERYAHGWAEQLFASDYPDLIEHRRSGDVISEAAVDEAIRRVKRSIAETLVEPSEDFDQEP